MTNNAREIQDAVIAACYAGAYNKMTEFSGELSYETLQKIAFESACDAARDTMQSSIKIFVPPAAYAASHAAATFRILDWKKRNEGTN